MKQKKSLSKIAAEALARALIRKGGDTDKVFSLSDDTTMLLLQMKGDGLRKDHKEGAKKYYQAAILIAEKLGKEDTVKGIREKIETL